MKNVYLLGTLLVLLLSGCMIHDGYGRHGGYEGGHGGYEGRRGGGDHDGGRGHGDHGRRD